MIPKTDGTHEASLRSWVESANDPATDFPVQNLPLGAFQRGGARPARVGCAIGDRVLDLAACAERGLLRGMPSDVEDGCRGASLNTLMALEPRLRGTLRHRLISAVAVVTRNHSPVFSVNMGPHHVRRDAQRA